MVTAVPHWTLRLWVLQEVQTAAAAAAAVATVVQQQQQQHLLWLAVVVTGHAASETPGCLQQQLLLSLLLLLLLLLWVTKWSAVWYAALHLLPSRSPTDNCNLRCPSCPDAKGGLKDIRPFVSPAGDQQIPDSLLLSLKDCWAVAVPADYC
jgi:hypothetical protein